MQSIVAGETWLVCLRAIVTTLVFCLSTNAAFGAPKPHVVGFGKWIQVKYFEAEDARPLELKVRALVIDAHVKEFTIGTPHDVTDRIFVVRRVFRLNDALPEESATT